MSGPPIYLNQAFPEISKRLHPGMDPTTIHAQSHQTLEFSCMGTGCTEWVKKNVGNMFRRQGDKSLIFCKSPACQAQRKLLVPARKVLPEDSLRASRPELAKQLSDPALASTVSKKSKQKLLFRCKQCDQPNILKSPFSIKIDELGLFCEQEECRQQRRAVTNARGSYEKRATSSNSFTALFPKLAAKQHAVCVQDLNTLKVKSNEYAFFRCECCGHPVKRQVGGASRETAFFCAKPHCEKERKKYSQLKDWKTRIANRGTLGSNYPALAAQWMICPSHPTLTPDDIPSNVRLEVKWKCPVNPEHIWTRDVDARTNNPGCPFCKSNISRTQLRFGCEIAGLLGVSHKHSKKFPIGGSKIEIDISLALPNFPKIAIEVDGNWWHQTKLLSDQAKDRRLKNDGWTVIRLRDDRLPAITTADKVVLYPGNNYYDQKWREAILEVLKYLAATTNASLSRLPIVYDQYQHETEYQQLCKFYSIG
ncbi:zinc-ribbon domain-containing protein [Pseudomonas koreensis]|uniref:zinc-ribbon domain-containing protein n=1 Tax=Pseudomonas koreensis TaxID=198620 RepID=UPI002FC72D6B